MFDEVERLREEPRLFRLLSHYAALDREAWQDRLMQLDGATPQELAKLHGELLAYAWVEQNTGVIAAPRAGAAPGCYRATAAGLRALKQGRANGDDEERRAA